MPVLIAIANLEGKPLACASEISTRHLVDTVSPAVCSGHSLGVDREGAGTAEEESVAVARRLGIASIWLGGVEIRRWGVVFMYLMMYPGHDPG